MILKIYLKVKEPNLNKLIINYLNMMNWNDKKIKHDLLI